MILNLNQIIRVKTLGDNASQIKMVFYCSNSLYVNCISKPYKKYKEYPLTDEIKNHVEE